MKNRNLKKVCPAKLQRSGGFTLVESLVAVSIFSIAVVTLLISLGRGLSDTGYVKKKITAEYLAAEGIEYMRNLRDTYILYSSSGGWSTFNSVLTSGSCFTANGCYFNDQNVSYTDDSMPIVDLQLFACTTSTCSNAPLLYNSATGKYGYTGSSSGFNRQVRVNTINVNEIRIRSTVYWTQNSGNYSITFSENLYNWVE
ncbi:MAG: hypothetical protein A3A26_00080 [Candidatus Zambryskibacteria bacterium RIFCSPLOWO2_01_FULL_47_14]|uniref:Prepilin-type N-terminal cleavage/methylation domain-containing protein n=1 Tax=Candidatus Zambryskibacteria bacterium RIFCSPLOWO2_01_FULL_47_14 TaxID=1802763 RepID=A0A1G2U9Z1_9BACT|nr:MAG: hypothetical protein A3A26_00080 [Candidatus Zambryskibacteria bacterium RIFCSPLOWO2_01_FULL_47_14]